MYRNTRFSDLLKGVSRSQFQKAVDQHQGDKHSKGFTCWDQLVSMIYAQLSGSRSLRELETSFNSHCPSHYHLQTREIKRTTLSEANQKRSADIYVDYCQQLLQGAHRHVRKEVSDLLYLLDSTPIMLSGRGYDWTIGQSQPHIPGLKLHVQYEATAHLPVALRMTKSNVNDIEVGKTFALEAQATYVFDKGYYDYNWWKRIDDAGARFVTRYKHNAGLIEIEAHAVPKTDQDIIIADEVVVFKNRSAGGRGKNTYTQPLRRVTVARPGHKRRLVLATNDMTSPAIEIAGLYKQRWGIELWFKWLKQHLKIKRFIGRSENAVKIQVLTALITYLLADIYRRRSRQLNTTFHLWLTELKATLMHRPRLDYEVALARKRRESEAISRQMSIPLEFYSGQ